MISISTHILNTNLGQAAKGMPVVLEQEVKEGSWSEVANGESNDDGRIEDLASEDSPLQPGVYRLVFDAKKYFSSIEQDAFYPSISISFHVAHADQHYHIPLLLNNYGYTTYRGT